MAVDIAKLATQYAQNLEELDRLKKQISECRVTLLEASQALVEPGKCKPVERNGLAFKAEYENRGYVIDGKHLHQLLTQYHESKRVKGQREDLMRQFGLARLINT